MPFGNQLKAARVLAGLEQTQLAKEAQINASTLSRMEGTGTKTVRGHAGNVQRVLDALASHGVEITDAVRIVPKPKRGR
jgi:transcriptional regulator with XRE-family HTH domain